MRSLLMPRCGNCNPKPPSPPMELLRRRQLRHSVPIRLLLQLLLPRNCLKRDDRRRKEAQFASIIQTSYAIYEYTSQDLTKLTLAAILTLEILHSKAEDHYARPGIHS